jgi:hypothetical protein
MAGTGNHYFAFGSNMDAEQMAFRELEVVEAKWAVLEDYRLAFGFPARERWLGGAADVVEEEGAKVEGVLYNLANDVSIMDPWEGGYRRIAVDVMVPSYGRSVIAWTYVVIDKRPPMTPSEVYVDQMLKGARTNGLSDTYISQLEAHREAGRRELGDHVRAVRSMAKADKPLALEELADAIGCTVDAVETILSDLSRWGWVQANNGPPVFRVPPGKEKRSPWVLR